jgi:prepilin-type N-terminal cleavage/methylation domain-containing protein
MNHQPKFGGGESGMTLIEILVAVTLLSLLSVAMLVAMRMGFNTMDETDAHLEHDRRVSNSRRIIESEIAGYTWSIANFHPAPEQTLGVPFAEWTPREMRFLTAYSLEDAWRGRPQIAVMQVVPGADNRGVRLIVNETPYTGPEQAGAMIAGIAENVVSFLPVAPGARSFVLADRLAWCRFAYLQPQQPPVLPLWRPDWVTPGRTPLGVRVEMAPLEARPAEAGMANITVPMAVNRDPNMIYNDLPF